MSETKGKTIKLSNGTTFNDIVEVAVNINYRETTWDVSFGDPSPKHESHQEVSKEYTLTDAHGCMFHLWIPSRNGISIMPEESVQ